MQLLASQIYQYMERSSWIRRMFETGTQLKKQYGQDNVCDFSLGNPDLAPPAAIAQGLAELADAVQSPQALGYMPNAGYPAAREILAKTLAQEQTAPVGATDVILSCGAAGGLNAIFRAILEPGDEVIAIAPFFVEYGFYAQNYGAELRPVPARPETFALDIPAIEAAIGPTTRAVLINSPNNPTGTVYSEKELHTLAALLQTKTQEYGRPLYLLADEPYRFLTYDDCEVPAIFPLYPYSIVVSSFSKSLSLAGERVGFIAVCPAMPEKDVLLDGLTLTNRILGYVNAPAIGQKLMTLALDRGACADTAVYTARRNAMARVLDAAGAQYTMPRGAFYFFPKVPSAKNSPGDDIAFVDALRKQRILAVPGTGFGCPGYYRLAFCVDTDVIERAAQGFRTVYSAFLTDNA